jgi:hypothetical protein
MGKQKEEVILIFLIQATRGGVVGAASIQSYSREG